LIIPPIVLCRPVCGRGNDDVSTFSLFGSDIAVAVVGANALNKITVINKTRIASSVLDFSANMIPPVAVQPRAFPMIEI